MKKAKASSKTSTTLPHSNNYIEKMAKEILDQYAQTGLFDELPSELEIVHSVANPDSDRFPFGHALVLCEIVPAVGAHFWMNIGMRVGNSLDEDKLAIVANLFSTYNIDTVFEELAELPNIPVHRRESFVVGILEADCRKQSGLLEQE